MNPLALLWNREVVIFHVRAGACGGCSDTVDNLIRFSRGSKWRLVECASPRHAELVVVTGCRPELFDEAIRSVIEQATKGCRVLLVGDCASGRDPFGDAGEREEHSSVDAGADSKIEGCPVGEDSIAREVKRCLGWR